MADIDNRDELLDEADENEVSGAEGAAGFASVDSDETEQEKVTGPSDEFAALREEQEEKRKKEEQKNDERAEARNGQNSGTNTDVTSAISTPSSGTSKENQDDAGNWAGFAPADAPDEDETGNAASPAGVSKSADANSDDAEAKAARDKKKKQAQDDEEYFAQKKEYPHSFLYYLAKKYEVDQASFNNITTKDAAPVKPVLEQLETVSAPEDPIRKYNRLVRERPLVTAYPVGTKSVIEIYRNKVRSKNTTLETAMVNAALAKANPGTYGGRVKLLPEGSAEAKAMLVAAAEFMGLEVVGKKPDEKLIAKYRAQCAGTWQVMQTRPAANPAAESKPATPESEQADAKQADENKSEKETPVPLPVTSPESAEVVDQPEQKPAETSESLTPPPADRYPEQESTSAPEEDLETEYEDSAEPPEDQLEEDEAEYENENENEAEVEHDFNEPEEEIDAGSEAGPEAQAELEPPRRSWLEKLARLPLVGWLFQGALEKEAKSVFRKLNELRGQPISEEDMNTKWKELPKENKQKIIDNLPYYRQDVAKLQEAADTSWADLQSEDHQEQREAIEDLAKATDQEPASLWENMATADRANIISNPGEAKKYAASLEDHKESLKWAETVDFDDEALDKEMIGRFLKLTDSGDLEQFEKAWKGELPEEQNLTAENKLFYLNKEQLTQTVAVLEQVSRMEWEELEGDSWKEQKAAVEALAKVKDEKDGASYWNKMNAGERLRVIREPQAAQQQAMMLGFLKAQQKEASEAKTEAETGNNQALAETLPEAANTDTSSDKENEKPETDKATKANPESAEQPEPAMAEVNDYINVLQTATPQPVLEILKDRGVSDGAYRAAMEKVISEQKISREFVRDAVDSYLEANPGDETGKLLKRDRINTIREALIEHGIATVTNRQVMSVVASEKGDIPVTASQDAKPNEEARNILKQAGISEAFYQAAKTELLEFAQTHPEHMIPPYQVKGKLLETGNYPTTNNKHRNNNNRDVIRAADKFMRAMQAEGLVKPKAGMEKKRYPNFVLANRPD